MTHVSLERIADTLYPKEKPTDSTAYGTVQSVNADGSYQVKLNASATTTRCAKLCDASVGDRVLVVIQANGHCAAIGRVGGDPPDPRADYVVEQGTSGQWAYRKWDSGIAECWGDFSHVNVAITSQSGNAWYSGEIHETFPSGLFNATPKYCDFSLNPGSGGASIEVGSGLSSSRTQSVWLMRVESGTTLSAWLQVHAIGTWK